MTREISLAAASGRIRPATYDELYGRTAPVTSSGQRGRLRGRLGKLVLLTIAFSAAMGTIAARERIVARFPAANKAYAALGMPVNLRGLAFRSVKPTLSEEGQQRILGVEGRIANVRNRTADVPDLRIAVLSDSGAEIYNWTAKSPKPKLEPGEEIAFRARLNAAPEGAQQVKVRFADVEAKPKASPAKK